MNTLHTLPKGQTKLINEIATANGMKNFKTVIKQGSLKGDGYTGEIILVDIEDESNNNVLHLVLKSAHKGDSIRDNFMVGEVYATENFAYDVIFKDFLKLQEEYNVQPRFDGTAKYYGGLTERNEECLILENLRELGFKLWNRKIPMDSHHVGVVMAQYGKFHGLSYAMKKLKPKIYQERSRHFQQIMEKIEKKMGMSKMLKVGFDTAFNIVKENAIATAALKKFSDVSEEFIKELMNIEDKYSVISHGDCWCNNMMFKYEGLDSEKPSNVYLLDWQVAAIGSPLRDLSYFFYACSSKEVLDNYEHYQKIYHNSLSEMLEKFGISVSEIMTFEEFKLQWQRFAKNGLQMAILIIRIMLTEQKEVRDLRELSETGDIMDIFNNDVRITNTEEYERRVRIVIDHMVENGFI